MPERQTVSLDLTDDEWDRVISLARAHESGTAEEYLSGLRESGLPERICSAVAIRLELGEVPEDPDERWATQRLGDRIELRTHLHEGGAAPVYLGVFQAETGVKPVAVKMFRLPHAQRAEPPLREAWTRERELLSEFSQGGPVPPLVEAGEHTAEDGTRYLYLCTEYKHGFDLLHWCKERALGCAARVELFVQVCDAVAKIHRHGLVHGDLKPANIQVEAEDGGARVWILDLGLTAVRGRSWLADGALLGTPGYMSPEQISDEFGVLGDTTDVYALGAILFELLENRPWLEVPSGVTPAGLLRLLDESSPIELRAVAPEAPRAALQAVLRRATALHPKDRYPQVSVFSEALRAVIPSLVASERGRSKDLVRLLIAAIGLIAVTALVFAVVAGRRFDAALTQAVRRYSAGFAEPCRSSDGGWTPASSDECTYALLAEQLGVDPGLLRARLPEVLKRLQDDPAVPPHERARASYVAGDYAEAEKLALQAAAALLEGPLRDPLEAVRAYETAAWSAQKRLAYLDAIRHVASAELLVETHRNPADWTRLQYDRAFFLYRSGDFAQALQTLLPTVDALEKRLGAEHRSALQSRNLLGMVYLAQGQPALAVQQHRRVLAVRERLLGATARGTLQSRQNLAISLAQRGDLQEAEAEYRELVRLFQKTLGPEHRTALQVRHNLATLLQAEGKHDQAEQEYRAVGQSFEQLLGPEHPDTLTSREHLAAALGAQGKYAEAEEQHAAVFAVRERTLGPTHPDTLQSRHNLAMVLLAQRKYHEAEEHCRAVLAASSRRGISDPQALASQSLLASILSGEEQYGDAEAEYRKLLTSYVNGPSVFGKAELDATTRRRIAACYVGLSWLYVLTRQFDKALTAAEEGRSWDPAELNLDANRAHALLFLDRTEEALRIYRSHLGQQIRSDDSRLWESAILADLSALDSKQLHHEKFPLVRRVLSGRLSGQI